LKDIQQYIQWQKRKEKKKTRFFEVCIALGEPEAMLVEW